MGPPAGMLSGIFPYRPTRATLLRHVSLASRLRALECDKDIPRAGLCLEGGWPRLVQVRCVIANCQRVAVQSINPLPRLPLQGPFRMCKFNGRRFHARVHIEGSHIDLLAVLGLNLKAVAGKREPMSDNIIGIFAVALGLGYGPGPLQFLVCLAVL